MEPRRELVRDDDWMTSYRGQQGTREVRVLCSLTSEATSLAGVGGTPHLRLVISDVSLADAPAVPVTELDLVLDAVQLEGGVFELTAPLAPGRHFAVSAHVDRSGDGVVAVGDLISTTRVPVTSDADSVIVDIPLTEVR